MSAAGASLYGGIHGLACATSAFLFLLVSVRRLVSRLASTMRSSQGKRSGKAPLRRWLPSTSAKYSREVGSDDQAEQLVGVADDIEEKLGASLGIQDVDDFFEDKQLLPLASPLDTPEFQVSPCLRVVRDKGCRSYLAGDAEVGRYTLQVPVSFTRILL